MLDVGERNGREGVKEIKKFDMWGLLLLVGIEGVIEDE